MNFKYSNIARFQNFDYTIGFDVVYDVHKTLLNNMPNSQVSVIILTEVSNGNCIDRLNQTT